MGATEFVQKWVENANKHDPNGVAALYAEDAIVEDPQYPEPLRGRAAVERDMGEFIRAFPDLRVEARTALESDDSFATEYAITATHQGLLAGPEGEIAPTGRPVTIKGASFVRLNGAGEIAEEHRYYDIAGMISQLGIGQ